MKRCVVCHRMVWPWQDKAFCKARFGGELREIQWHRLTDKPIHHMSLPDEWAEWMAQSDDGIIVEMVS